MRPEVDGLLEAGRRALPAGGAPRALDPWRRALLIDPKNEEARDYADARRAAAREPRAPARRAAAGARRRGSAAPMTAARRARRARARRSAAPRPLDVERARVVRCASEAPEAPVLARGAARAARRGRRAAHRLGRAAQRAAALGPGARRRRRRATRSSARHATEGPFQRIARGDRPLPDLLRRSRRGPRQQGARAESAGDLGDGTTYHYRVRPFDSGSVASARR